MCGASISSHYPLSLGDVQALNLYCLLSSVPYRLTRDEYMMSPRTSNTIPVESQKSCVVSALMPLTYSMNTTDGSTRTRCWPKRIFYFFLPFLLSFFFSFLLSASILRRSLRLFLFFLFRIQKLLFPQESSSFISISHKTDKDCEIKQHGTRYLPTVYVFVILLLYVLLLFSSFFLPLPSPPFFSANSHDRFVGMLSPEDMMQQKREERKKKNKPPVRKICRSSYFWNQWTCQPYIP